MDRVNGTLNGGKKITTFNTRNLSGTPSRFDLKN